MCELCVRRAFVQHRLRRFFYFKGGIAKERKGFMAWEIKRLNQLFAFALLCDSIPLRLRIPPKLFPAGSAKKGAWDRR